MTDQQIIRSFKEYAAGNLSGEEKEAFLQWYAQCSLADFNSLFAQALPAEKAALFQPVTEARRIELEKALEAADRQETTRKRVIPMLFRYAAAVIIIAGIATWIYTNNKTKTATTTEQTAAAAIQPGGNKATLLLADGKTIVLDSAGNGTLAQQGNANIVKLNDGQIAYNTTGTATQSIAMNTLSTPRGGQFKLTLPDGSQVWLNAASSIRFPAVFTEAQRKVEVTGEVYFEVRHTANNTPFIVSVNNSMEVQVLGTHFNINAYTDEASINTTLLEGSVKIVRNEQQQLLQPGQQAQVKAAGPITLHNNINTAQIIAWKNGAFNTHQQPIAVVMRQLARWYDIEIEYQKGIPNLTFWGKIGRNLQLAEVIEVLKDLGMHCRLEGRKLIVLPS